MSVLLIGFSIVLPVVMVLAGKQFNNAHMMSCDIYIHHTGALQFNECPFMNKALLYCIVIGGIVLGTLTCLRFSICCVYYLGNDSGKQANGCSNCLCCMESLFLILAIGYLLIVVGATYLTFNDPPDEMCPPNDRDCDDYCDDNVYQLLMVLVWIQLAVVLLFVLTFCVLLMGVKWCCCVTQRTVHLS